MLPMLGEILSSSQSCGLADAAPTGHAYRAIRGRCCVVGGGGPAPAAAKGKYGNEQRQHEGRLYGLHAGSEDGWGM
jgi:hypothetical protein